MRLKKKDLGPYCVAVDSQYRLCLSERIRNEFNIKKLDHVYVTLDHTNVLLVFKDIAGMMDHAHKLVEKMNVPQYRAEFLLFSRKARVRLDERGRIVIPKNLVEEAKIGNIAKVTVLPDRLIIMDPEHDTEMCRRIAEEMKSKDGAND